MPKKHTEELLSTTLEGFDYHVDCGDFLLYELGRLIEEDRASLEDEEFRRVIDDGIHEHVDTRIDTRAEMAHRIRIALPGMDPGVRPIAARVLRAIEDIECPLRDMGLVVRSYTTYLFHRLEACAGNAADREDEARIWIDRWQKGEVLRQEMTRQLKTMGEAAVAPVADLLFDSLEDRTGAETAVDLLGAIPCPVSARVLTHAISEPMLEEDLEAKACGFVRAMWPLPRHYIVYSLRPHTHEDIPFRWFQLLVDCREAEAVERILEEIAVHAQNPAFKEDLVALVELLGQVQDPAAEDKIMQMLNNPETSREAAQMLETLLKTTSLRASKTESARWDRLSRLQSANKKYLASARLFDSGRNTEAIRQLDELLQEEPGYPLAVMLQGIIQKSL